MEYVYAAKLEADPEGGFLVTFPDVPEAITAGDSEALSRIAAVEALGLALRGIVLEGRRLPPPRHGGEGLFPVPVAANDALKLALIEGFRASGLSKSEFARRLGKGENEARRLLDPDHPTKLAAMQTALAILGKSVVVSVRDAA